MTGSIHSFDGNSDMENHFRAVGTIPCLGFLAGALEFHNKLLKLLELPDAILEGEIQVRLEQGAVNIHHVCRDHRITDGRWKSINHRRTSPIADQSGQMDAN